MDCLKRILCSLLAALVVLPVFACGGETANSKNDSETSSETTSAITTGDIYYEPDDLPELDFGGETVVILSPRLKDETFFFYETDFTVEELTSNVVNDSIYNRELYVEDRLGVEINNIKDNDVDGECKKIFAAGEDLYDAVISTNTFISECAIQGFLTDLNEVDYINIEKSWWSQNFAEEAALFDELYMLTGSVFLSLIRSTYAVYYNKNLALDYVESVPELANIYSLVDSGKWTIDTFVRLGGEIYQDINGNTERDFEDVYGIAYNNYIPLNAFWSGFDINIFSRTEDGWFELDINTDKLYTALDKLYDMLYNAKGSLTANTTIDYDGIPYSYAEASFASGTNLFLVDKIGYAEKDSLRNMQDDYGILPYPKYDENQSEYYSFSDTSFCAVGIPVFSSSTDTIGAVLEAIASYSYRETRPLHLDTVLKGQYMSDPDSRRMVDIVIDGIMIDAAWIYIDTLSNKYPEYFMWNLRNMEKSFASTHEGNKKKIEMVLKSYKKQLQ